MIRSGYYTADRLRQLKRSHELWIQSLVVSRNGSPVGREEARLAREATIAVDKRARAAPETPRQ